MSGSSDNTIKIFDLRIAHVLYTLYGHNKPVNSVTFSNDGN